MPRQNVRESSRNAGCEADSGRPGPAGPEGGGPEDDGPEDGNDGGAIGIGWEPRHSKMLKPKGKMRVRPAVGASRLKNQDATDPAPLEADS